MNIVSFLMICLGISDALLIYVIYKSFKNAARIESIKLNSRAAFIAMMDQVERLGGNIQQFELFGRRYLVIRDDDMKTVACFIRTREGWRVHGDERDGDWYTILHLLGASPLHELKGVFEIKNEGDPPFPKSVVKLESDDS
jgi:hypothetical protein